MYLNDWKLDSNILNVYRFGSVVYETTDSFSDEDYVLIVKDKSLIDIKSDDTHIYTIEEFNTLYKECDIQILECVFLPNKHILKQDYIVPKQEIDLSTLRVSISSVVSNSWVKGKKKILKENEVRLGIKSIFHAFRILDYGIQIARYNNILNYRNRHGVLRVIQLASNDSKDNIKLWEFIHNRFKKEFNNLRSEFKLAAPMKKNKIFTSKDRSDLILEGNPHIKHYMNNMSQEELDIIDKKLFDLEWNRNFK